MEDSQIIDLYWARSEQAVQETDTKYGGYCRAIAHNILRAWRDSEVRGRYVAFAAWNRHAAAKAVSALGVSGAHHAQLSLDR